MRCIGPSSPPHARSCLVCLSPNGYPKWPIPHFIPAYIHSVIVMAPNSTIFHRVAERFHFLAVPTDTESLPTEEGSLDGDGHEPSLIDYPIGASPLRQFFHVLLFPFLLVIHFTVLDTRGSKATLSGALLSITACLVWIVVGSFAMVESLEHLGGLLRIPDSVIGITISAAGTSLPNFVASQVAARQGLGNMAVSNAFGSNIFNIFVGLGLPWTIYTAVFGPYGDLKDDEITTSVIILVVVLLVFAIMMFISGFVLRQWHAVSFVVMYGMYLVYAIGEVYV